MNNTDMDRIRAGIALLPELQKDLHRKKDLNQGYVIILEFKQVETIIAALEASSKPLLAGGVDPFPIFTDRLRVRREQCDEAEVNFEDSDILALAMDVLSEAGWKSPDATPAPATMENEAILVPKDTLWALIRKSAHVRCEAKACLVRDVDCSCEMEFRALAALNQREGE